jgi:hypothetical protein
MISDAVPFDKFIINFLFLPFSLSLFVWAFCHDLI